MKTLAVVALLIIAFTAGVWVHIWYQEIRLAWEGMKYDILKLQYDLALMQLVDEYEATYKHDYGPEVEIWRKREDSRVTR